MLVIDCHDHIYKKRMAEKAVKAVGEFYEVEMSGGGTVEELVQLAQTSPIKRFVVNSVAVNPSQVRRLNDFVAGECEKHPELVGLGALHPDMENSEEEIERIISLGLKGVKLHPDTQQFDADCENAMKLYEQLEGRLPLLIHCGDHRYDHSHPGRIAKIIDAFPKLTIVAAHLGGWSIFDQAVPYMKDRNCYMDISSVMPFMTPQKAFEYIRLYGADRLLFGSDFPMWDPLRELESFLKFDLSDEEREKILWKNAAKVFGIDCTDLI